MAQFRQELYRSLDCLLMIFVSIPLTKMQNWLKRKALNMQNWMRFLREGDVVSVHTAKNPQTIHMIGKKQFELLKDGALFINTSRGAVINELELIEALKNKNFTAVLDVYEKEPLEENNPLRSLKNVILFPHMAGPTYDMREKITSALIDDLILIDKGGKSSNEITKEMALRMTIS